MPVIQQNRIFAEASRRRLAHSLGDLPQEEWLSGHGRESSTDRGQRPPIPSSKRAPRTTCYQRFGGCKRAYGLGSLSSLRRRGGEFIRNFSRAAVRRTGRGARVCIARARCAASRLQWMLGRAMSCRDALDDLLLPVRRPAATLCAVIVVVSHRA